MSCSPAIRLGENLTVGYGAPLAACDREIALGAGTHYLLARNGRGKTTLLRTLAGTLRAVAGRFEVAGRVRYLAEDLSFDGELPAGAVIRALVPRRRRGEACELAGRIELDLRKPYAKLSTGNRRKVLLVLAECSNPGGEPEVLFLDEPFSGLDAACREVFEQRWQHAGGHTLRLVSCHPDSERMAICSAVVIHHGRIAHQAGATQSWQDLRGLLN